jgi:uncharacterized membrane protein YjjP (DUF1212 family)
MGERAGESVGDERVRVVLRLGEAAHRYGCSTPRVEECMALVARKLALEGAFFAQPTSLFAGFGRLSEQRTVLVRFEPGVVDLGKRWTMDALIEDLLAGTRTPRETLEALDDLERAPPRFGQAARAAAFVGASVSAARFFGASGRDLVAAAACGLLVWAVDRLAARSPAVSRAFEMLAAALVSAAVVAVGSLWGGIETYTVTLSGLIVLVPGLSLTTAISELSLRHLVAGTSRLMGAMMTFLQLGFGVALGRTLTLALPPGAPATGAHVTSFATLAAALVLAPASFAILLQARARDLGWVLFASTLAYLGTRQGAVWMGPELGAFLGAFLLAICANLYARRFFRPSAILLLPGLLMLVPGSLGFRSLSALMEQDVLGGVSTAIAVALVATSLVAGLFAASALVRPRGLDTPGA